MIKKYLLALMQQDVLRAFQRRRCVGHGEQMVKKIHYRCRCFSSTHIHNSVCNEQSCFMNGNEDGPSKCDYRFQRVSA